MKEIKNKQYLISEFEKFIVIGNYYNSNKKFKLVYSEWFNATSINLWNGRIWGVLKSTGKRVLLKKVTN